jgi:metal transporter CNNM
LKILSEHHLLLVTLLLSNAMAMEALPICLNELVSEITAVFLSVTAVLVFGEVLPQAICTGPNQIKIASAVAPMTRALMMMEGLIGYPISKLLDCVLGERGPNRYTNEDLKTLIALHASVPHHGPEGHEGRESDTGLNIQQRFLIRGAIDLANLSAKDVMRDYDVVTSISVREVLSEQFLKRLQSIGYSRYPVFKDNRNQVIGILLVKQLLGFNNFDVTLEQSGIPLRKPLVIGPNKLLTDLLVEFQKGKSHIALVTDEVRQLQKNLAIPAEEEKSNEKPNEKGGEPLDSLDARRGSETGLKRPVILGIITIEDVVGKAMGR